VRRLHATRRVRIGVFWALVLVGGGLQYAYTSTSHPSTVLTVWAWAYGIVGGICLLGFSVSAIRVGSDRFKARRAQTPQ
jgi:hypothetical protein